jgi:hypothetical protein
MRALAPLLLLAGVPAVASTPAASIDAAAPQPESAAPAADGGAPEALPPVVPPQAVVEKLGHGDRLFLAGEYRNALFAYLDAVYLEPRYAPARVKLGRAYLALRYAPQALAQAEAALATDPSSEDARALLEEARSGPSRPVVPAAGAQPAPPPGRAGPRVFRLTPQAPPAAPAGAAAPAAAEGQAAPGGAAR